MYVSDPLYVSVPQCVSLVHLLKRAMEDGELSTVLTVRAVFNGNADQRAL